MARLSPTQRTLKYLRDRGYTVAVTERWNPHAKVRNDLFGWIDLVALEPDTAIIGIQCTSGANVSARVEKIKVSEEARTWQSCGGKVVVIGWRKVKAGAKKATWQPRMIGMIPRDDGQWDQWEIDL